MPRHIEQLRNLVLGLDVNPRREDFTCQKQEIFSSYAQGNITAREMLLLIEDTDDRVVKLSMRGMSWVTKILVKAADFALACAGR